MFTSHRVIFALWAFDNVALMIMYQDLPGENVKMLNRVYMSKWALTKVCVKYFSSCRWNYVSNEYVKKLASFIFFWQKVATSAIFWCRRTARQGNFSKFGGKSIPFFLGCPRTTLSPFSCNKIFRFATNRNRYQRTNKKNVSIKNVLIVMIKQIICHKKLCHKSIFSCWSAFKRKRSGLSEDVAASILCTNCQSRIINKNLEAVRSKTIQFYWRGTLFVYRK